MAEALRASLLAEKARTHWEFATRQVEMHERRLLQLLAVALAAALAVLASVLLERVSPLPGMVLSVVLFGAAGYLEFQIARLPRRLGLAYYAAMSYIDILMRREDES